MSISMGSNILILVTSTSSHHPETEILLKNSYAPTICTKISELSNLNSKIDLILLEIDTHFKQSYINQLIQVLDQIDSPVICIATELHKSVFSTIAKIHNYGVIQSGCGELLLFSAIDSALRLYKPNQDFENKRREVMESEARYRTFFENNDAIIMLMQPGTGKIIFSNQAAVDFYGYSQSELVGMYMRDINILPPDEIRDRMKRASRNDQNYFLFKHRLASGAIRDVEVYQSKLIMEGNPVFSIIVHDITDRLRAEEDRKSLERQVQHTQKLESLGVLAGGIAHDFNNILTSILGNADLAISDLSHYSPVRDYLTEIKNAARRAADLAKQMLAYSGKGRFVVEPIHVGDLLTEMAHLLEVSISKKVRLKYNISNDLATFEGDATQLRQVVMNLITNASDAIGDSDGMIALSTGIKECDRAYLDSGIDILMVSQDGPLPIGPYVYIEVSDTGCGMDDEIISRIFDPFFTTKFTGRGLGMAAVLGIVRGHKGTITIESELGKGTTFKVLFPAPGSTDSTADTSQKTRTVPAKWHASGTILIVDDEESVRTVGKRMLEKYGFSVKTAIDGLDGVKVFKESHDDIVCVLLDLTMPQMDGEQTYLELIKLNPAVKVILCSGYSEQEATQNFLGKGLAGFLKKPYTLTELRSKLQEIIDA